MTPGTRRPVSVLEEERDFLLRSLRDLEAEHDAGDIDDTDYTALKDDYTARAASVLRELAAPAEEAPEAAAAESATGKSVAARSAASESAASESAADAPAADAPTSADPSDAATDATSQETAAAADEAPAAQDPPATTGRRRRLRRWAIVGVVGLAFGGLAGWAVVAASGNRAPGQTVSGTAIGSEKVTQLLDRAQKEAANGNGVAALKDCQAVLAMEPGQPQALAEEGWLLAQTQKSDLQTEGLGDLNQALSTDPQDNTAHLYRGIVLVDLGRGAQAVPDLQWYLSHNPAPQIRAKVQQVLAQAQAATPAPNG